MKRASAAISILAVFAVIPTGVWFGITKSPFTAMAESCTDTKYWASDLRNKSSNGIQSLFTIDRTFEAYKFSTVKFIDVVWDLCIARGMQFMAGWVSYRAITGAMVHTMESVSMPYDTFIGLGLNGSGVSAICSTAAALYRHRPMRITILFGSIVLSMIYAVMLPTLLSAATGYVSSSDTYVTLPGTDQLISLFALDLVYATFDVQDSNEVYCLNFTRFGSFQAWANHQMSCCRCIFFCICFGVRESY